MESISSGCRNGWVGRQEWGRRAWGPGIAVEKVKGAVAEYAEDRDSLVQSRNCGERSGTCAEWKRGYIGLG